MSFCGYVDNSQDNCFLALFYVIFNNQRVRKPFINAGDMSYPHVFPIFLLFHTIRYNFINLYNAGSDTQRSVLSLFIKACLESNALIEF